MAWFDPVTGDPEDTFRTALVSIRKSADGTLAGGAVCLGGRYVLTCAHVLNLALGREAMDRREPTGKTVEVRFGGAPERAEYRWAELAEWIPPTRRDGGPVQPRDTAWEGDLAVLALESDLPDTVRPPDWTDLATGQRLRAWYGSGQPLSAVDCTTAMTLQDGAYVQSAPTPREIVEGYSGGPLWCRAEQAATGLVAGALSGTGSGLTLVIPWQKIRRQSQLIRAAGPFGADRHGPAADLVEQLAYTVGDLLRGEADRAAAARALCEKLGLGPGPAGTAPGQEEFAALLLGRPRAAAALAEHFWELRREDLVVDLLGACHQVGTPRILSPNSHRGLIAVLDDLHTAAPDGLPSETALLAALRIPPLARSVRGRSRYLRLVDELEARRAVPERVSPLLRYVEHLAAALVRRPGGQPYAERLRRWSERTAGQQGVPAAGLREQRANADEWAALAVPEGAARVAVRLSRYEHAGHGTAGRFCRALWADQGDGALVAVGPNDNRPVRPEQIAEEILAAVDDLEEESPEGGQPVIEVFLEQRELSLPVEDWTGTVGAAEGAPEPLGIQLPVVVRLAGRPPAHMVRKRPRELGRRWRTGGLAEPLDLGEECTEVRHAVSELHGNRDAAWVVIRGGTAAQRTELAAACLAVGVPIVLWDRAAAGPVPGELFDGLIRGATPNDVPQRLREYRASAFGSADGHPLRPVLAWEHPGRPGPPDLVLTALDEYPRPDGPDSEEETA
ncbi:trypsin-like peptidase domain-containing protein [Streptomyces sp. TLI_171]|uniref:VMAP-C domain-containing protein n=1 Tax=Streptomyces sp. TLI_171 TaxID=1938859 RepID=UPI000C196C7E|nr:trypsin-like peptidase domain-containing protein [Streptomyces sp. TLI_171]RKE21838.1 trypsin-like peptidase [Streptomyces sp. TLI_171]